MSAAFNEELRQSIISYKLSPFFVMDLWEGITWMYEIHRIDFTYTSKCLLNSINKIESCLWSEGTNGHDGMLSKQMYKSINEF